MYTEDELLPLSGLQHMAFCERQWALIHLEQAWAENILTAEGRLLHERVHEQTGETRQDVVLARGLPVRSLRLGLSGQTDVVEYRRVTHEGDAAAIVLLGRSGRWRVRPVEYKREKAKHDDCDRVQLCAQALCLEEMLGTVIPDGALFYGTPRRRTEVVFDEKVRRRVEQLAGRMQALHLAQSVPPPVFFKGCLRCSLKEMCLPEVKRSVQSYYHAWLRDA